MAKKPPAPRMRKSPKMYFFMAVVTMYYMRDDALKERPINILLELPDEIINQEVLQQIQTAALQRLNQENNVDPSSVRDAVIVNIVRLAHCRPEEFHLPQPAPQAEAPAPDVEIPGESPPAEAEAEAEEKPKMDA